MIYLDHAATTPTDERVICAMADCMRTSWHNPSAAYAAAGNARREMRNARKTIAGMLNAQPNEIIFTSGGTEGNNLALQPARGKHAVIFAAEHASVLHTAERICSSITRIPPDESCRIHPEAVLAAIRPDTALISVQYANNETGALQPVSEIGAIARKMRIPFHCDAVQAFGHVPVDVKACNIDLLTLSAHKFYGPRGAGALYVRQGIRPAPLLYGGGQEFSLRAGTENLPAICGMARAAQLAQEDLPVRAERESRLMRDFVHLLHTLAPECIPLCGDAERLPAVQAILIPGLKSEQAIADLDLLGIQLSGGAACASGEKQPSHVYRAMGLSEADAGCVIRISIGCGTSQKDMIAAAHAIAGVIEKRIR